jgi:alpha-tubulin suppressor-like RCC1 family protein
VSVASAPTAHASTDPTANVLAWGYHYYGYFGDGTGCGSCYQTTPGVSPWNTNYVTQISAGPGVLALHADGSVTGWGRNDSGELGDGYTNFYLQTEVHVELPPVSQISAGGDAFGLALEAGEVWSWGNDTYYNLGRYPSGGGSYDATPLPITVGLPSTITSVSAGMDQSLALTSVFHAAELRA